MVSCCSWWPAALSGQVIGPYLATFLENVAESMWGLGLFLYLYNTICEMTLTLPDLALTHNETNIASFNNYSHAYYFHVNATASNASNKTYNCTNISPDLQDAIQQEVSSYLVLNKVLQGIPSFFMSLICGGWMDRVGLRLPVLITEMCGVISMGLFLLLTQALNVPGLPMIFITAALLASIGPLTLASASFEAYVSWTTPSNERTARLSFLIVASSLGVIAGSMVVAVVSAAMPLWIVFAFVGCFFLGVFFVELTMLTDIGYQSVPDDGDSETGSDPEESSIFQKAVSFYKVDNIKSTVRTFFRQRPNDMRRYLFVTLIAVCLSKAAQGTEQAIILLFVMHAPLSWTNSECGYLTAFSSAMIGINILIFMPLFSQKLEMSDMTLAIVCSFSKAMGLCLFSVAETDWLIYMAAIYMSLVGVIQSCLHSTVSKMLDENEQGRCFNIIAAFEVMSDLLGSLAFTQIYYVGLSFGTTAGRSLPFLVMAGFYIIIAILSLYVQCYAEFPTMLPIEKPEVGEEEGEEEAASPPPAYDASKRRYLGSLGDINLVLVSRQVARRESHIGLRLPANFQGFGSMQTTHDNIIEEEEEEAQ